MSIPLKEYEGPWEEILTHSNELAGQKVHVTVLPEPPPEEPKTYRYPSMYNMFRELERNPWTPEEMAVLDEFEQFQKEQRRRFYGDEEEA